MAEEKKVVDNQGQNQFEVEAQGKKAILKYGRRGNDLVLFHTEVPPELEGQGIGSLLARTGLETARQNGLKVIPLCPFVQSYLKRHPEYDELIVKQ